MLHMEHLLMPHNPSSISPAKDRPAHSATHAVLTWNCVAYMFLIEPGLTLTLAQLALLRDLSVSGTCKNTGTCSSRIRCKMIVLSVEMCN